MTIVIPTGTIGEQGLCVSIMWMKEEEQKEAKRNFTDIMLQKLWESQLSPRAVVEVASNAEKQLVVW